MRHFLTSDQFAQHGSCIVNKFSSLLPLSDAEASLLAALEQEAQKIGAGQRVMPVEQDAPPLLLVQSGWLISEHTDEQGQRTIVRSHHPGDIIGFTELPYRQSSYQSVAKSNSVICPFTRKSLNALLRHSPRMGSIFLAISLIEQSQQDDRNCLSRCTHAAGKVSLFILQTMDRLQMVDNHSRDRFHCPLTQADIGDLTGMTNVHVSRTLKKLEEAQFIRRQRSFIQILNETELTRLAGYTDRFKTYDFSWIPPPTEK